MGEIKKLIIFTVIVLVVYGCAPKKEIEQPKIITSMEVPKEDENTQKEQIIKEVQLYIEKREYEKAVLELNKAIELDPEDASLYYTLGNLYEQLGKDKESVEAFVKALQLDPEVEKISQEENSKGNYLPK
ncbi:MAG: tetratricopeptide repeat protein [bacterium]